MNKNNKNIIVATGGTGGHIFPAVTLANYLNKNGFQSTLTTDKRGFKFIDRKLSVRQAENLVKILRKSNKNKRKVIDPNIQELENSISEKIGLNVSIKNTKNNKGVISIYYKELDQLNKIIDIIKSEY